MAMPPEKNLASIDPLAPSTGQRVTDADYRRMVESVVDYAILLLDPDGLILSWNRGAQKINGCEAGDVLGRHTALFYPPERVDGNGPEHGLKVARETGFFEDEGWRLRKDGSRFWATTVITRITGPHGELTGFSEITRDLTERRRQDELLRLSEERFRLLVEGVQDYAIFMLDPGGHVVSWNAGAQKNKGYAAAEIIGQHFSVFYPPEVAKGWPDEELRIARQDGRFEDEGWRMRKDGGRFWANVVITSLNDAAGRHRGFAKVTRDLTERRRVTALEDEGRRITNFVALLGHELRNPLAPISNAVALMERENSDSKALRATREIIGRQLRQMNRLVDDLLDVGRITSGKIQLEARPVHFIEALHEAVEAVRPLIDGKSHVLAIHSPDDPWVMGDRARIVQVLSNLIGNAAKFTPDAGRISVRIDATPASTQVRVIDNGPGIPPHCLHKVFDLFFQGEQDMARSQGGLGLGLSLVQQLVVLHGGEVSAFSKGIEGEGSEFVVRLPTALAPAAAPAPVPAADKAAEPLAGKRVLVVDDNRDAAETMAMLLDALGYVASMAHDGLAGIEAVKAGAPDLVLLDIGLPGISGIEVARRIRAEVASPPPLIAITGYGQPRDIEASLQAGFHDHLTKPVDVDKLVALLDHLLGSLPAPPASPPRATPGG